MDQYKFIRKFGNKKAGGIYPLPDGQGKLLSAKGICVKVDSEPEKPKVKTGKKKK